MEPCTQHPTNCTVGLCRLNARCMEAPSAPAQSEPLAHEARCSVAAGSAPITNSKRIKWEKERLLEVLRKKDWWAVQCSAERIQELAAKLEAGEESPSWPNGRDEPRRSEA
jgi:hypothetical protein